MLTSGTPTVTRDSLEPPPTNINNNHDATHKLRPKQSTGTLPLNIDTEMQQNYQNKTNLKTQQSIN
jgi:hypothetical protein